jgi:outer membrane receptor protein involved in Fe transport
LAGVLAFCIYQEARIQSDQSGPLKWLVGGYYGWDKTGIDYNFQFNFIPYIYNSSDTFTQERRSYAEFARIDYGLTSTINVFGGVRNSHDRVEGRDLTVAFGATTPGVLDSVLFSGV